MGSFRSAWFRHAIALLLTGATLSTSANAAVSNATCPLAAAVPASASSQSPVAAAPEDPACLIKASAISAGARIYDLRSRPEYLDFHVPGAVNASSAELARLLRGNEQPAVIYDGGKFRSDAFLLCARLRAAGARNFKIIEGGIASWTQVKGQPERLSVSRLSDQEVSALLTDPRSTAVASSNDFRNLLSEHRIRQGAAPAAARRVLLVDPATPDERLRALLDGKGATAFYWKGEPSRLLTLVHAHLAQNQKRIAGPAQSSTCSAL